MELLLVTPISPNQIIFGRAWGLWLQFLPTGATLLFFWLGAEHLANIAQWRWGPNPQTSGMLWSFLTQPVSWGTYTTWGFSGGGYHLRNPVLPPASPAFQIFVSAIGFLTLPVFATYFALRVKNLIVAGVLTWVALLLCPYFAFTALGAIWIFSGRPLLPTAPYEVVFLTNLAFAMLACFLLRHSLSRRIYSF